MRYVESRLEERNREEAYRIYVSKCLQIAPQGKYMQMSYTDLVNPKQVDNRSGDEIAFDVISKAGLHFEE